MPLTELLPVVTQLSHSDKLRLIQVLLLAVAEEDGCDLQSTGALSQEALSLEELASTKEAVQSPLSHDEELHNEKTLSELLTGLTGTINSKENIDQSPDVDDLKKDDAFGEAFLAKMAKQGIHLP